MIRRIVLALVVAVLAAVTLAPAPAYAIDFCKDAPAPSPPKRGMSGLFTAAPAEPVTGDPFADPSIAITDVYGTSWHWSVYDLGCTPNALSDPTAVFNTSTGNQVMDFAAANIAILNLLERVATEFGVGWFADWTGNVAEAIRPIVLGGTSTTTGAAMMGLLPLAMIVAGLAVAWRARSGNFATAARTLGIIVVCLVLAAWALVVPGAASRATDELTRQVATVAGSSFNASLTDGVNRHAVYRSWLAGQFGDPDSDLAKEYGPQLMAATHYTWTEWAQVQNDPDAREAMDDAKAAEYKRIAEHVKDTNPSAYETFKGQGDRIGPAVFAVLAGGLMGLFALVAYFTILMGRVVMQLLVIAAPIAAVLGLLPAGDTALRRMWDLFTAAIWAVFKFTLAAGAMATVLGALATLDPVSALLWMTVTTVAAFMVLKPARAFKTITPGLDPNRSYLKDLGKLVGKLGAAAVTGGVGGAVAANAIQEQQEATPAPATPPAAPTTTSEPQRQRVDLSAGLPDPKFEQVPGTNRFRQIDTVKSPERPALEAGPSRWDGVLPSQTPEALPPTGEARELPAAPLDRVQLERARAETHGLPSGPAVEPTQHGLPGRPVDPARLTIEAGQAGTPESADGLKPRPVAAPIEESERLVVTQITEQQEGGAGVVVIEGEVVSSEPTPFYRPETSRMLVDAEVIEGPAGPAAELRDSGPSNEVALFRPDTPVAPMRAPD